MSTKSKLIIRIIRMVISLSIILGVSYWTTDFYEWEYYVAIAYFGIIIMALGLIGTISTITTYPTASNESNFQVNIEATKMEERLRRGSPNKGAFVIKWINELIVLGIITIITSVIVYYL